MIPSSSPNAQQQRWLEAVAELGPLVPGDGVQQIHHIAGRAAKHQKIAIGHFFIICLPESLHKIVGKPEFDLAVFGFDSKSRHAAEKFLFTKTVEKLPGHVPLLAYDACLDWDRWSV